MTDRQNDTTRQKVEEQIKELLDSLPAEDAAAVANALSNAEPEPAEMPRPTRREPQPWSGQMVTSREEPALQPRGTRVAQYQPLDLIEPHTDHRRRMEEADEMNDLSLDSLPPEPRMHRAPHRVIGGAVSARWFHRDAPWQEWVRKSAFWLAALALLLCLVYAVYALCLLPAITTSRYAQVEELYADTLTGTVAPSGTYPDGMRTAFSALYDRNEDVRGFIRYHAYGNEDFLDIDYPVMCGDTVYLDHDFYGYANENGTPFLDSRCRVDTPADNRVLIVYGNNTVDGGMFSGLNDLIGSPYGARSAATLTFSTLFEEHNYEVFAVVLTDEDSDVGYGFDARRTTFADDSDFLSYVEEIRRRSLFTYAAEITAEDKLLVLSTVASPSVSKLDNARVLVYARQMDKEDSVSSLAIRRNDGVVMPLRWYLNQDLPMHEYYEGIGGTVTPTTTTAPSTTVTEATTTTTQTTGTTATTTTRRATTAATTTTTTTAAKTTTTQTTTTTEVTTTTTETTTTTTIAEEEHYE